MPRREKPRVMRWKRGPVVKIETDGKVEIRFYEWCPETDELRYTVAKPKKKRSKKR